MSRTTGPILVAGTMTFVNQSLLDDHAPDSVLESAVRIGVPTGLLAGLFYGFEKMVPELAIPLAYTLLVTALVIRFNGKPGPVERMLDLATG
jgi:hypothetical protein